MLVVRVNVRVGVKFAGRVKLKFRLRVRVTI
jgi:hypothetical protein